MLKTLNIFKKNYFCALIKKNFNKPINQNSENDKLLSGIQRNAFMYPKKMNIQNSLIAESKIKIPEKTNGHMFNIQKSINKSLDNKKSLTQNNPKASNIQNSPNSQTKIQNPEKRSGSEFDIKNIDTKHLDTQKSLAENNPKATNKFTLCPKTSNQANEFYDPSLFDEFSEEAKLLQKLIVNLMSKINSISDDNLNKAFKYFSEMLEKDIFDKINIKKFAKAKEFNDFLNYINNNISKLTSNSQLLPTLLNLITVFQIKNETLKVESLLLIIKSCVIYKNNNLNKLSTIEKLEFLMILAQGKYASDSDFDKINLDEFDLNFFKSTFWRNSHSVIHVHRSIFDKMKKLLLDNFDKISISDCSFFYLTLSRIKFYRSIHDELLENRLLETIKSRMNELDIQSVILLVDSFKFNLSQNKFIEKLLIIVNNTIKNEPSKIKFEFLIELLKKLTPLKDQKNILTPYAKKIIDYLMTLPNLQELIKHNFSIKFSIYEAMDDFNYEDKDKIQIFTEKIKSYLYLVDIEQDSIISFQNVILNNLGPTYVEQLNSQFIKYNLTSKVEKNNKNKKILLKCMALGMAFICKSSENLFDKCYINYLMKTENHKHLRSQIITYIKYVQLHLLVEQKYKLSEYFLKEFNQLPQYDKNHFYVFMNYAELYYNEDQLNSFYSIFNHFMLGDDFKMNFIEKVHFVIVNNPEHCSKTDFINNIIMIIQKYIKIPTIVNLLQTSNFLSGKIFNLLQLASKILKYSNYDYELKKGHVHKILQIISELPLEEAEVNINLDTLYFVIEKCKEFSIYSETLNYLCLKYLTKHTFRDERNKNDYMSSKFLIYLIQHNFNYDLNPLIHKALISQNILNYSVDEIVKAKVLLQHFLNFSKLQIISIFNEIYQPKTEELIKTFEKLESIITSQIVDVNSKSKSLFTLAIFGNLLVYNKKTIVDNKKYFALNNNYNSLIEPVFSNLTFRELLTKLEKLCYIRNNYALLFQIYDKFVDKYIKESVDSSNILLNFLLILVKLNWRTFNEEFYEKIMEDFNKLILNQGDSKKLIKFISYFSSLNYDIERFYENSLKNIKLSATNLKQKVILLNSLVYLGFENNKWRNLILSKILDEIFKDAKNIHQILAKEPNHIKLSLLISIWRMEFNSDEFRKKSELVINSITDNSRYQEQIYGLNNIILLVRHPLFQSLNPTVQMIYNTKFDKQNNFPHSKIIQNLLGEMGHKKNQLFPEKIPCDIYLPNLNLGIIILDEYRKSTFNEGPSATVKFMMKKLKEIQITPILIDLSNFLRIVKKRESNEIVSYFESLGIVNLNSDKLDLNSILGNAADNEEVKVFMENFDE